MPHYINEAKKCWILKEFLFSESQNEPIEPTEGARFECHG